MHRNIPVTEIRHMRIWAHDRKSSAQVYSSEFSRKRGLFRNIVVVLDPDLARLSVRALFVKVYNLRSSFLLIRTDTVSTNLA